MRLLLDEMYPPRIALGLRKRGHDVIALLERPELRAMDDAPLLQAATADGRAIVSENVIDFVEIASLYASEKRDHAGVVLVPSATFPRTERGFGTLVRALDAYLTDHAADEVVATGLHWLRPSR